MTNKHVSFIVPEHTTLETWHSIHCVLRKAINKFKFAFSWYFNTVNWRSVSGHKSIGEYSCINMIPAQWIKIQCYNLTVLWSTVHLCIKELQKIHCVRLHVGSITNADWLRCQIMATPKQKPNASILTWGSHLALCTTSYVPFLHT